MEKLTENPMSLIHFEIYLSFKCITSYIQDLELVIIVSADGLAPPGARPSAGTMMTTKTGILHSSSIPFWTWLIL